MVNPKEPLRKPAIARAFPTQNSIESQPVSRAAGAWDADAGVAMTMIVAQAGLRHKPNFH